LKNFFDKELKIEPAEELEFNLINAFSEAFQMTDTSTSKQRGAAIEGGKAFKQIRAQGEREQASKVLAVSEISIPKGAKFSYKEPLVVRDRYLLAKADKDFKFHVFLGNPIGKGAGVGAAAGAISGALVGSVGGPIGAGVGALFGAVFGIPTGVVVSGVTNIKKVPLSVKKVFSLYGKEDKNWKEEGRDMVYKVKYNYKH